MRRIAAFVLVLLLAGGCGGALPGPAVPEPTAPSPSPPPPAAAVPESVPDPAPKPEPAQPDLTAAPNSYAFTLTELKAGLERLANAGSDSPAAALRQVIERWGYKYGPRDGMAAVMLAEADLNGDGSTETITALNAGRSGGRDTEGRVFVIYRSEGRYAVDMLPAQPDFMQDAYRQVSLHAVTDLTGDGRPEIVWFSQDHGAHTGYAYTYVTGWAPGAEAKVAGPLYMSFPALSIEGADLVLSGGTVGSAGAGTMQRRRTDRYRWNGSTLALVDRQYAESDFSYHRLLDGMVAEQFGRTDDALAAYREALAPPEGKHLTDGVMPEWQERFREAVPTYARLRLAALLLQLERPADAKRALAAATGSYADLLHDVSGATTRDDLCAAAVQWAAEHPEFLEALNATWGYASPRWHSGDMCTALPVTPER